VYTQNLKQTFLGYWSHDLYTWVWPPRQAHQCDWVLSFPNSVQDLYVHSRGNFKMAHINLKHKLRCALYKGLSYMDMLLKLKCSQMQNSFK